MAEPEQLTLVSNTQSRVCYFDYTPSLKNRSGQFFFSHSSTIFSRPICSLSSASRASCSRCLRSPLLAKTLGSSSSSCRFQALI